MTDLLRIAHPQNCPPYGNSRVGICEIHLILRLIMMIMIKDDNGHDISHQVGLANTVDSALMEFSIDGKGCIAKSM